MHTCYLQSGSLRAHLAGPGVVPPLRACRRGQLKPLPGGEEVEETFDLALEGPGDFDRLALDLEQLLTRARLGTECWLWLGLEANAPLHRAPVTGGRLTWLARDALSAGLRLTLRRADYWEGGERTALPLSNPLGAGQGPQRVTWACNWVAFTPPPGGSLETGLCLEAFNDRPGALPLAQLLAFTGREAWAGGAPVWEGEEGLPGPNVDAYTYQAPAFSGGHYRSFQWSTAGPVLAAKFALTGLSEALFSGEPCRAALALVVPPAAGLRLWWRLTSDTGVELAASIPAWADPQRRLQVLAPLACPEPPEGGWSTGWLELWAEASALPATLPLDQLQVLPARGFRAYRPLEPTPAGWVFLDDPESGQPACSREPVSGLTRPTHVPAGPPLLAWPGAQQALFLLWDQAGGLDLNQELRVRLSARPRRSAL